MMFGWKPKPAPAEAIGPRPCPHAERYEIRTMGYKGWQCKACGATGGEKR